MARAGELPFVRIGAKIAFEPEAIEQWIKLHRDGMVMPTVSSPEVPADDPRPCDDLDTEQE